MPASDQLDIRSLCRAGALLQAVRDIKHGFPDFAVIEYVKRYWKYCDREQAAAIVALAHKGIAAAKQVQRMPIDKQIPPGVIPRLPQ